MTILQLRVSSYDSLFKRNLLMTAFLPRAEALEDFFYLPNR